MANPAAVLAGASGDLGFRIAGALIDRRADVRALVRPDVSAAERTRLEAIGLHVTEATRSTGTRRRAPGLDVCRFRAQRRLEVMIDRQGVLLDATVQAGVPRFIPSDHLG